MREEKLLLSSSTTLPAIDTTTNNQWQKGCVRTRYSLGYNLSPITHHPLVCNTLKLIILSFTTHNTQSNFLLQTLDQQDQQTYEIWNAPYPVIDRLWGLVSCCHNMWKRILFSIRLFHANHMKDLYFCILFAHPHGFKNFVKIHFTISNIVDTAINIFCPVSSTRIFEFKQAFNAKIANAYW